MAKSSKYRKYHDGDFQIIDTKGDLLKLACCDCGLVHYIGITIVDDSLVKLQFVSDKRATAQLRRHKYGSLQQGGNIQGKSQPRNEDKII